MKMTPLSRYVKRAKELGAQDARVIPARTVVTGEWVRLKCQYGCSGYNRCLTCPPHSPTPETTRRMLGQYQKGLLIHGGHHRNLRELVAELEREIFLDGYHKAFGMPGGPCHLCEKCPSHCRHPYDARPAMEACGIDVFSTVRAHGFPIEVVTDRKCERNYYALILIK